MFRFSFLSLFFLSIFCFSQENKETNIQEILITSTKTQQKLKDTPITVQVITAEQIRKSQSNNFQNFLENEISGVHFTYEGGSPQINIMGFGGKYILFLIDGERLAGETFDNIDYDRINLNNIERIEIIKGATSSLYGSNAIGGVINIITKNAKKKWELGAGYQYDTQKEERVNFNFGMKRKYFNINLSSFYKNRTPYILNDKEPFTTFYNDGEVKKLPLASLNIAGFTNFGLTPKMKFNISPKFNIEFTPTYYFNERNRGDEDSKKVRDRYYDYNAVLKANYDISEDKKFFISGAFDRYEKYKFYRILNEKEKDYSNDIIRINPQYNQTLFGKNNLVAGGEIFSDRLMSFMFNGVGNKGNGVEKAQSYALFTQQEWKLNEHFTLVTGGRLDYHSRFKEYVTFRLSGMYRFDEMTIRGGYSGGFRSPTLKELFTSWFHPWGGGFQVLGNKNLRPEISDNANVSVDFNLKNLNLTFMTQYSSVRNKIATIWNKTSDTLKYVNFEGRTNILGTEVSAAYKLNRFRLKGSYSYYNIEKRASENRPHSFTFSAEYQPRAKYYVPNIILSGRHLSSTIIYGQEDNGREYVNKYPAYTIWRLQTSLDFPYGFTANLGVNNLFNYQTKTTSFYSPITMGRTYYFGLNWNL